METLIKVHKKI